jgi:hypothetical protein
MTVPCYLNPVSNVVTVQHEGPTSITTHWGIYLRTANGSIDWYTDCDDEVTATSLYERQLLDRFKVKREPQAWRSGVPEKDSYNRKGPTELGGELLHPQHYLRPPKSNT